MTTKNPAADLVDFLHGKTAGGVALTKATNLFKGPMRAETPAPCVFALNTGGPQPESYAHSSRRAYYHPTVQLLIRGPAGDIEAGEDLARGVFELVHQLALPGYVTVVARDSQAVLVSVEDSAQHPVWAVNVEAQYVASLG